MYKMGKILQFLYSKAQHLLSNILGKNVSSTLYVCMYVSTLRSILISKTVKKKIFSEEI